MRAGRIVLILVLLGLAFAGGIWVERKGLAPAELHSAHTRYQCAMHPQIVSDQPGLCPICQMKLAPVLDTDVQAMPANAAAPKEPGKILFYRHPMRADITSPHPAKDEMGMDYIPVREEDLGAEPASDVPGHAPFALSAQRQQMIGVTREKVQVRDLHSEIRAVGKVAYDPGLYQAMAEYREALKTQQAVKNSTLAEAREGANSVVRSAGLKLRQMGISEAQMREMTETGGAATNLLLPGKSVWVYAQVYEYEVDLVRHGQGIEVTTVALPGRVFPAKVVAIDSILNPTTRTARIRALVETPDVTLRPETFVNVKIRIPLGEKTAIPEDAILDTGEHQIAFVVKGEGSFEPRSVQLGRLAQGYYEVLSGVTAGEEVVTAANFLIDSESRFRAALAAFRTAPTATPSR